MEDETPSQAAEGRRRLRTGVLVLFGIMLACVVAAIVSVLVVSGAPNSSVGF
jgi:hypothetical protein